jgi:hypothetical protein
MNRLTQHRLRILDALVAEHIFGWKWFSAVGDAFLIPPSGHEYCRRFHVHWTEGLMEDMWRGKAQVPRKCKKRYDIERTYNNYSHWEIPHYSTLREDGFLVAEHLGKTLRMEYWKEGSGVWRVFAQKAGIYSEADTLQAAFVLFALNLNKIELPWKFRQKPRVKAV